MNTTKIVVELLKKQFEMIGLVYSPDTVKEAGWYREHTWTKEQEAEFLRWGNALLKKRGVANPGQEMMMYLLCYGWKTNE